MTEKSKKIIKRTPAGRASYPWLTRPDTKFNKDGVYVVDMIFQPEAVADLTAELEEILESYFEEEKAKAKPAVAKKMTMASPVKEVFDDEGDETGEVMLRFKQNRIIKGKDDKVYTIEVPGFDAQGKPLKKGTAVYGGSVLKINFEVVPYMSSKDKECGLSLRLRAYQVIELVSGNGGSAERYGFEAEEDGYTQDEDEDDDAPFDDESGDADDEGADDF